MFGLFLTFLKPFNTIFALWCIVHDHRWLGAIGILWLMVCDIFDGYFVRRSSFASNKQLLWFRRVFDVTLDYLAVISISTVMVFDSQFPLYLYLFVFSREILLLIILLYGYWQQRPLREPNLFSRLSAFSAGVMAVMWLIYPNIAILFVAPLVIFGILGAQQYYRGINLGIT